MKNTYFSVKPGAKGSEFYGGGNSQGLSDQGTKYQGPKYQGLSDGTKDCLVGTTSVEYPGNHPVITLLSPSNHPLLGSGGQVVTDRREVLADRRGVLADRRGVVAMMRQKCMMWKYVAMLLAVLVLSVGNIGMAWGAAPITDGKSATAGASGTVTFEDWTSLIKEKNYWKDGIKFWNWSSGTVSSGAANFTTAVGFGYYSDITAGSGWGSYSMSGLVGMANFALGISVTTPSVIEIIVDNNQNNDLTLSNISIYADNVAYDIPYSSSNYTTGTDIKSRAWITRVIDGKGRYKINIPVFASDLSGSNPYIVKLFEDNSSWSNPLFFVFESITVTPYIYLTDVKSSPESGPSASKSSLGYNGTIATSHTGFSNWGTTSGASGYYLLTWSSALDLSSYKDLEADVWWGTNTTDSRGINLYVNGGSSLGQETDKTQTMLVHTKSLGAISSLSSLKIGGGGGGGSSVFFRVGIRGTYSPCSAPSTVTVAPTAGIDGNYGWRYTIGETIDLTCTATGGSGGSYTYQWQKYIGSSWEDIDGATNARFQKENCTSSDGGSYRCVVSTGEGCSKGSDEALGHGYYVRVFTLDGNYYGSAWNKNAITWTGENTGTVTLSLEKSRTFEFKVRDNDQKEFGYTAGNYIIQPWSNNCGSGDGTSIRLFTGPAGDYTITLNVEHANDVSAYVNVDVAYPSVTHPADGYVYLTKWSWDPYVHYWDGSGSALTADGSDPKITTYTEICDNDYWYFPVLDNYVNFLVKDNTKESSATNKSGSQTTTSHSGMLLTNNGSWVWQNIKKTISFNANGGTGTTASVKVCPGADVAAPANGFTRTGWTFTGWNTEKHGKGTAYAAGDDIDVTEDITLYAQWERTVYLKSDLSWWYNKNGDDDAWFSIYYWDSSDDSNKGWVEMELADCETNVYKATLPGNGYNNIIFVRKTTDHDLDWDNVNNQSVNISYPTTNPKYTITSQISEGDDNGKVTGSWGSYTEPEQYTITFAPNGGSGSMSAIEEICEGIDQDLTANAYTKTGYDFGGWRNSVALTYVAYGDDDDGTHEVAEDASGTVPDKAKIKAVGSNIKMTARWKAQKYDITYRDKSDVEFSGTHEKSQPTKHTYNKETTLKLAFKAGYVFGGWYTSPDCLTGLVTTIGATDYTASFKLYAKWTAMNLDALEGGTLYTPSDMVPSGITVSSSAQYYPGVSANNRFNLLGVGNSNTTTGPLYSKTLSETQTIDATDFTESLYSQKAANISSSLPTDHALQFKISGDGLLDIYCYDPVEIYLIEAEGSAVQLDASGTGKAKITKTVSAGTYYIYTDDTGNATRLYGLKFTPKYAITHSDATNGSYTIKVGSAAAVSTSTNSLSGETITLAATPSSGYVINGWNVTGATVDNNNIASTSFTMPASDVTVAPTFKLMPNVYYYQDGTRYASSTYKTPKGEAASSGDEQTINSGNEWTVSNSISGLTVSAKGCKYDGKSGDIIYMTSYLKVPKNGDASDNYVKFVVAAGYKATSLKMKIGGYKSNPTVTLKPYTTELGEAISYTGTVGGVATKENNFNEISWSNLAAGTYYLNVSSQNAYISEITAQTESTGYVISFAGNGNTGGSTASHTAITSGADVTLNSNGYTKTGYNFSHWIANVDVTVNSETVDAGDPIEDGATIENVTSNIVLTAQWTIQTFNVTFAVSPEGYGTVSGNTIADVPYNTSISTSSNSVTINGSTITATAASQTAQYTYAFDSWSNASGNVTAERTITANFTRSGRSYTVTLNANGGTINPGNNVTSYTYGVGATLPTDVTKSGYMFGGWYDNSGLTGSRVTTIASDATGNKEYWAKWTALSSKCVTPNTEWTDIVYKTPSYEGVTYNLGGINDDASSITLTPAEGEGYVHLDISSLGIIKEITITLSGVGETNNKEKGLYYAFDKTFWDYNEDYTETDGNYFDLSGSEVIRLHPTGDATKCTFSAYGTTVSISEFCIYYEPSCTDPGLGFESPSLTKYTGESVSNTLTNTHNVAVSYSSSNEAVATVNSSTGAVTIKGVGTTTITATAAAQTVSAVSYCADVASYNLTVNPYTITYNLNGGAWGEVSHKDTYTKFDDGYDLPTPTKTDYTFLGWYANSEFTGGRVYILPAGSTGDKTYYAKWGSAVTATWSVTKVDSKLYRGGGGHHVKAVLDQDAWDASGSANDLDLSASEGVTLSSVTKGVYTSGDNNGKAYVEADFSISGDIDEDEISFFLNVPATEEYAAAELSKKQTLNDCPSDVYVVGYTNSTGTGIGSASNKCLLVEDTWYTSTSPSFTDKTSTDGFTIDCHNASSYYWAQGTPGFIGGTTTGATMTALKIGNNNNCTIKWTNDELAFSKMKIVGKNTSDKGATTLTVSNDGGTTTKTFTFEKGTTPQSQEVEMLFSSGETKGISITGGAKEINVLLELTASGVPTTLSWSGSLADKAEVNKNNVDADFIYTAIPNTNTIGAITYTSSDESVATVDGNGKVHIIKGGETTITATLAESGCYTGAEITYDLNVKSTCVDARGTIVAADGSAIAGNSIEKGACETVTLKLTGYTDGATIQWQKDGADIIGATSAEYTVPTDGAGVYTAVTTKACDLTSNSVTVTSASLTIAPTIFADEFTVKSYRPFEYRLMQLNEGETCTFESAKSWKDKYDFEITTEGNIVTIKGYIGIDSDAEETITLKISNGCSDIYKDIIIHATTESPKPMIAWIATGEKGVKDNVLADQSTNTALYKALEEKDKYALTPRNCYWTTDEKELIKEYSQYDLVILTDYPNSRKGPNSEDDRSKSYTNALGLLIDRVPMLTFEAFVAGCPNWGLSSNPKNTSSTQNSLTLLCNANDIFGTSDAFNAGASVAVGTAAEGQALQGFELDAMPNFVFIAKITDGGTDYVTCCERQVNTNARMMVFGLNQNLMNAITDTGEDMVAGFVDYLLLDETASIPDCSVIFKGTEGTGWSNTSNWEGASLPNPYASVRIDAPCVVGDGVTAKAGMIKIHTGSEGGYTYTGSLTIQPQGRMIVENGVYRVEGTNYATYLPTEPNNLVINADEDYTGALIFSNPRRDTQATVYLYSKATTSEHTCWQYVGIPFGSLSPAVSWFYNAWMMKYTTGTKTGKDALYSWEYISNYDVLNGFQGYALTQTAAKSYQLQGGLAPTTDKVLAVSNAGGKGWNLYANSWTAPIHIDKMEASDFVNADATIYLYNTGSRANWNGSTVDETGTSTTAGQYLAVPVGLAEYTGTKYIPSMQGFFVQGNHASAAGSVRLRYDAVVRDTTVMADLNTPLRTPSRETVNQEPEHVTMVVRGEKYTDVLHLFRSDEWSAGYENGYDAHKVEGDDYTPQLYAVTGKEELAVVATDEWEGTVLNFRAGSEDGEYTIFFRYNESEAEALYLYDLTTETYTRIENGGSYHFSTTDKETHPRFILTYNAPSVATGTGDVQRDDVQSTKARKVLLDNHVYIFRNGKLYDSTGKMVK